MKAPVMLWALVLPCSIRAALAVSVEASVSPPNPDDVSLPVVPAALAAKGGFPELPTVETMLQDSSQTLTGISTQSNKLLEQLLAIQKDNANRIQRQKTVFDRKLKEQEEKNVEVVKENAGVARDIMDLKKVNQELLEHTLSLQKGNSLRRKELEALQEQLSAAQVLAQSAFTETDDSKAAELEILKDDDVGKKKATKASVATAAPPFPKEEDQEVAATVEEAKQESQKAKAVSFLELKQEPAGSLAVEQGSSAEPEALVTSLNAGVKSLQLQGQQSIAKLKELFSQSFQTGVKRHRALLKQQEVLQDTLKKMKAYHADLQKADDHLKQTQGVLDQRLKEGSVFLAKVSQVEAETPEKATVDFLALKASERQTEKA